MGDVVDVDAPRRHVGGHQNVDLAAAERAESLLALALPEVAVHGRGREAALLELLGDHVAGALGLAEHHREPVALALQHAADDLDLVHAVRAPDELDRLRHVLVAGVGVLGADVRRPGKVTAGQGDDLARHRGGEQHGLPLGRDELDDALDVGKEAQVEHAVGLVQDQHGHLAEVEVLLVHQVEEAAGRADDDVDALLERLDLGLVRAPAVDGEDARAQLAAGDDEVLGHLEGQLARRDDDEPAGLLAVLAGLADALQHRHAEGVGLAGACARLADDILSADRERKGHLLNGER